MQSTPDSFETTQLLERAGAGDRRAVSELLERHRTQIRRVIDFRLDPQLQARVDASDIVQEAEIDAFQRLEDYLQRRPMPFRLWLRKTALERLGRVRERHVQAAKRSVTVELPLSTDASEQLCRQLVDAGTSPSGHAMKRELVQRVRAALAHLSEADRELLLMRHVEKMSNADIGYVLDATPEAVSKRHVRCLLRLRQALKQFGIEVLR